MTDIILDNLLHTALGNGHPVVKSFAKEAARIAIGGNNIGGGLGGAGLRGIVKKARKGDPLPGYTHSSLYDYSVYNRNACREATCPGGDGPE